MTRSALQIEQSIARMRRLGRWLSWLFTAFFVGVCGVLATVAVVTVPRVVAGEFADLSGTVSIFTPVLDCVIWGAGALILRAVSVDMARGASPFTVQHARSIRLMGWLLLLEAVLELAFSPGFLSIALGAFQLVGFPGRMVEAASIPIDAGVILGAIVCFSMSAIWHYGALLQEQTEDLV